MFGWIFGRKKQKVPQSTIPKMILRDPWEACGRSVYITQLRPQIEGIAKSLPCSENSRAYTRFNKGHTLLELLVCLVAVSVLVSACMANAYFTEDGVLRKLQGTCPGVKRVVNTERNIFTKSVITVETYDGALVVYFLDSDILFNYDLKIR